MTQHPPALLMAVCSSSLLSAAPLDCRCYSDGEVVIEDDASGEGESKPPPPPPSSQTGQRSFTVRIALFVFFLASETSLTTGAPSAINACCLVPLSSTEHVLVLASGTVVFLCSVSRGPLSEFTIFSDETRS